MAGRTVRVSGLPADLPPDRVADKLTIHFLRARHGGGEIADVRVLPGAPACALVTFEEAAVAWRVLEAQEHVLSIGGKRYPLEVTAHAPELSPDEIFIHVYMIVDYGKLPAGKTLLRTLHKGYSSVQINFDSKDTHCIVKGPFTELQAFSRDLLCSLNIKSQPVGEILLPGSSHEAQGTKIHDQQQVPVSVESAPKTVKLAHWDQVCEKAAEVPSHRVPVDGEAMEQLEDFSLVMDSDIYLYMQRFCAHEYHRVLHQHHVDVVDVSSDGIVILYLQPSAGVSGDMGALGQARLALQQLYQQLEVSLRKEKIDKRGLDADNQTQRTLSRELQKLYPQLLCHEDERQLYLIGNLVDVSQARQYLRDFSTRRKAAHTVSKLSSSLPSHLATSHTTEAALHKPKSPMDASPSRLSPGRLELKGEPKLAANFSTPKASRSQASPGILLNQDSPLVGQAQLSGKHLSETDALSPSDPTALNQQAQPCVTTTNVGSGSAGGSQQKDPKEWARVKGGAVLTRPKTLSPFESNENSILQHSGDSKGSTLIKHRPLTSLSGTFQSLNLFDTTRTSSTLDAKPSESKTSLRRSNSFSLPKSKESNKPQDTARAISGGSRVSEDMSLDSLQWSYLKNVCCSAIDELCRDGGVQISEHRAGDCTVLTLQAEDRNKLCKAKWKVEMLVQKCPDLVCQSMSYSELAIDGPDDNALSELCSLLQGSSLKVGLSKDKYKLYLACPKEMLSGVTEAFQVFSSRRLCALKASSVSPGPARALSAEPPSAIQPSRSQDAMLGAALPESLESLQMGLQHLDINDKAAHSVELRAFQLQGPEEMKAPSPWQFQQALGQEETNDYVDPGAVQGGSSRLSPTGVDNQSPAGLRESQELLKTKLSTGEPDIARLKQVLPDRFQFARHKSRGGRKEERGHLRSPVPAADGAPHSLPTWLYRTSTPELHQATAEQSPAAEPRGQERALPPLGRTNAEEEPDLSSLQTRGPSPGQETCKTPLNRCDACQDSCVTCQAPCGHALCRTCFAADSTQPACCRSTSVAPGCKLSGTFRLSSLSQSLPGYYRDLTLQVVYNIPDGVQGVGDPCPGHPYRGGTFHAYLPDNREGQKTAVLLKKAFEHGLTFQIKSFNGEGRVTWGHIPHKTSWDGGKARNGYPDAQYLHEVCTVLKKLGIA
uniref:RING-type E3 ubiquitin transferase n=1 Tax=Apteryx owenii TaxID=8824 RepID=A0A8B9PFX5_APTOW